MPLRRHADLEHRAVAGPGRGVGRNRVPVEADRSPRARRPRTTRRPRTGPGTRRRASSSAAAPSGLPTSRFARASAPRSSAPDAATPRCARPGRPRSSTSADPPGCSTCRRVIPRRPPRSARGGPARAAAGSSELGIPHARRRAADEPPAARALTADRRRRTPRRAPTAPAGTRVRGASRRGTSNGQSSLTR